MTKAGRCLFRPAGTSRLQRTGHTGGAAFLVVRSGGRFSGLLWLTTLSTLAGGNRTVLRRVSLAFLRKAFGIGIHGLARPARKRGKPVRAGKVRFVTSSRAGWGWGIGVLPILEVIARRLEPGRRSWEDGAWRDGGASRPSPRRGPRRRASAPAVTPAERFPI